ncbi:MAG TPA: toll/interleukin-1 receptor domain-containing protein, partial [Ktedonobacteraceae bacterium]|nr:toll/interleukin-1 receptor domain-containing protein [Ktedonobacteraceae bacterium]
MMKTNHVFISYSRDQFYFAEFLALRLQKQGVSTWFDMQRLTPGVSWQDLIESGLSSCIGLVLIASKSAFASDYVRNEWQLVLAAKKPIYIVLFETVSIPSELQNATIIDMRSAFNSKIDVLVKTIRTGATYRDPLPRISRLPFPMRLPPAIWFVACALSIGTIAYISMMLLFL